MAREWQSVQAAEMAHPTTSGDADGTASPLQVSRSWSASRGTVHWQGPADLVGSFPGYTAWGGRAAGVTLSLTDRFLLVEEAQPHGFGLPLGWLSAARNLTGIDPIVPEPGEQFRVTWVDGARVRGFMVRVRGGRFGSRAGRRANQLRSATLGLELGAVRSAVDIMLPPEHDLALDWDAFAAHERETVIWSGRATMPVANGLDQANCDVWLTTESLIWGASSRDGIYRVATSALSGVVTDDVAAGGAPAIYLGIGGLHQTQVDLPMILGRPGSDGSGVGDRLALIDAFDRLDIAVRPPTATPQPWRAGIELVQRRDDTRSRTHGTTTTNVAPPDPAPAPAPSIDERAEPIATGSPETPVAASEATITGESSAVRTRSTPLPWGPRVERAETVDSLAPVNRPARLLDPLRDVPAPIAQKAPAVTGEDGLRIWPPLVPDARVEGKLTATSLQADRRPTFRTTTEEFLASEAASRLPATESDVTPRRSERGVLVSFRSPGGSLGADADASSNPAASPEQPATAGGTLANEPVEGIGSGDRRRPPVDCTIRLAGQAPAEPTVRKRGSKPAADWRGAPGAIATPPVVARDRPASVRRDRRCQPAVHRDARPGVGANRPAPPAGAGRTTRGGRGGRPVGRRGPDGSLRGRTRGRHGRTAPVPA